MDDRPGARPPRFAELVQQKKILVCAGSGGVGKTTTAATLALEGARSGRKTLVLTIDPAKRLANSLGLPQLDHEQRRVPDELLSPKPGGELWAMMLDQKRAFDEIVAMHAKDPAAIQRILDNRIYRQISSSLTGAHEYAAMAKLQQIHNEGKYDLIVVDTPPTAHALDFLDSPEKLATAIDSPAVDWFVKPFRTTGSFSLKLVGVGGAFVLKRIAKFVGSSFLEDMARFFVEFNDVLGGFRVRAREVFDLLRGDEVGFVLVAAPEPSVVDEVLYFHDRLSQQKMPFLAFVVNRVVPTAPAAPPAAEITARLAARPELSTVSPADVTRAGQAMYAAQQELAALADADDAQILRLRKVAGAHPVVSVPFLDHDVHDIGGLTELAGYIFKA